MSAQPHSFHRLSLSTGLMMVMMAASSACAFRTSPSNSNHYPTLHRRLSFAKQQHQQQQQRRVDDVRIPSLEMAAAGSGGGGKEPASSKQQRRRRRKKSSSSTGGGGGGNDAAASATTTAATAPIDETDDDDVETALVETKQSSSSSANKALLIQEILAREQIMMNHDEDLTSFTPVRLEMNDKIAAAAKRAGFSISGTNNNNGRGEASSSSSSSSRGESGSGSGTQLEDLFDSREFLQRKREKQMEENAASSSSSTRASTGGAPVKKKIKRSDIEAFNKLLEMDPIADEDDSYFEDEGIDFISALLGDVEPGVGNDSDESSNKSGKKVQKKTSFLGIGSGPLQVGHFIGALGVILMAFVEYPGFPLTNLPDPLRASLQGGTPLRKVLPSLFRVDCFCSMPSFHRSYQKMWLILSYFIRTWDNLPCQHRPCRLRCHVGPIS